jgi:hypothetical protein
MRILIIAAAVGCTLAAGSQAAFAGPTNPFGTRYCASFKGSLENCGFYSFEQCLASINGVGGICVVAPVQTEVRVYQTPHGPRRYIRDAID